MAEKVHEKVYEKTRYLRIILYFCIVNRKKGNKRKEKESRNRSFSCPKGKKRKGKERKRTLQT